MENTLSYYFPNVSFYLLSFIIVVRPLHDDKSQTNISLISGRFHSAEQGVAVIFNPQHFTSWELAAGLKKKVNCLTKKEAEPLSLHWRTWAMWMWTVVVWKSISPIFSTNPPVTRIQPGYIPACIHSPLTLLTQITAVTTPLEPSRPVRGIE